LHIILLKFLLILGKNKFFGTSVLFHYRENIKNSCSLFVTLLEPLSAYSLAKITQSKTVLLTVQDYAKFILIPLVHGLQVCDRLALPCSRVPI